MDFLSLKFRVRLLTTRIPHRPLGEHLVRFIPPFLALLSYLSMSPALNAQHQHDALTEQQLGTVRSPTSCDVRVQRQFERGVALLHSFAFDTAEIAFRQVAQDDPHCAMAHWRIATT